MYFRTPFASSGDITAIPEPMQGDGSVSFTEGFGFDYQRDLGTDPAALAIPRNQMNWILNQITLSLQQWQQQAFPAWIAASDNDGSPYAYAANAYVLYTDGNVYQSIVAANTATPGTDATKWALFTNAPAFRTADVIETYDATLPAGWLWMDGKTIGNATSGATGRANADAQSLFTTLWNSITNTVLPIQDSAGNPSTRGLTPAADFSANKRLPIPDRRGKVAAAADNLGGTAAGILTGNTSQGINGTVLGNGGNPTLLGGEQAHLLILSETPSHDHLLANTDSGAPANLNPTSYITQTYINQALSYVLAGSNTPPTIGISSSVGGGQIHNNVQPTIIANFRIKL